MYHNTPPPVVDPALEAAWGVSVAAADPLDLADDSRRVDDATYVRPPLQSQTAAYARVAALMHMHQECALRSHPMADLDWGRATG
jgi:hypothetical protein